MRGNLSHGPSVSDGSTNNKISLALNVTCHSNGTCCIHHNALILSNNIIFLFK